MKFFVGSCCGGLLVWGMVVEFDLVVFYWFCVEVVIDCEMWCWDGVVWWFVSLWDGCVGWIEWSV